jgi:hypothetical protein
MVFGNWDNDRNYDYERFWRGDDEEHADDLHYGFDPIYNQPYDRGEPSSGLGYREPDLREPYRGRGRRARRSTPADYRFSDGYGYERDAQRDESGGESVDDWYQRMRQTVLRRLREQERQRDPLPEWEGYDPEDYAHYAPGELDAGAYGLGYESDWLRGRETRYPWEAPGPYTGVGPQGYRRRPERILEQAYERLMAHGSLDARGITLAINHEGLLTLAGWVHSRRERRLAEETVEDVPGVEEVSNRLQVREPAEAGRTRGYWGATAGFNGQVREGMPVLGSDGRFVGRVKRVRENDFLVNRPLARDVYVPFLALMRTGERVHLAVEAGEVGGQGWEQPDLF